MLDELLARFEIGNVIRLTREEEMAILEECGSSVDYGSSRMVYKFRDRFVVKVALDEQGRTQNAVELDFYEEHWDTGLFAHLFATGIYINVMEQVTWDCEMDYDDPEGDFWNTVNELNEVTEYDGGDNEQVAWSQISGRLVAYDYGCCYYHTFSELVGDMDHWTSYLDIAEVALLGVRENILFTNEQLDDLVDKAIENHRERY